MLVTSKPGTTVAGGGVVAAGFSWAVTFRPQPVRRNPKPIQIVASKVSKRFIAKPPVPRPYSFARQRSNTNRLNSNTPVVCPGRLSRRQENRVATRPRFGRKKLFYRERPSLAVGTFLCTA